MRGKRRGQSTLEYILVFAAIVAAVIAISAGFGKKVGSSINSVGGKMESAVDKIDFEK